VNGAPIWCPECIQGKHQNCTGQAWDFDTDTPTRCECTDEQHYADG
jgi:hypothetical protein